MEPAELAEAITRATTDARVPSIRFALDGEVIAASEPLLVLLGYGRDEFLSIDWDGLTPRAYWGLDEICLAQLAKGSMADPYVKEFTRKNGSRVAARVFCARSSGGNDAIAVVVELAERTNPFDDPLR